MKPKRVNGARNSPIKHNQTEQVKQSSKLAPKKTHLNDRSSEREAVGNEILVGIKAFGRFLFSGIGSYFGAYAEAGSTIADGIGNLWRQCCSFLKAKPKEINEEIVELTPVTETIVANPKPSTKPVIVNTGNSKEIVVEATKETIQKEYLQIKAEEIKGCNPQTIATILLEKIAGHTEIEKDQRFLSFLHCIENGASFNDVASSFNYSRKERTGNISFEEVKSHAINTLKRTLEKYFDSDSPFEEIVKIICSDIPQTTTINKPETTLLSIAEQVLLEEPLIANDLSQPLLQESIMDPEPLLLEFPKNYIATIDLYDQQQIQKYKSVIGIADIDLYNFLPIDSVEGAYRSTLPQDEVTLKIAYLEALSSLKLLNKVEFPSNADLLDTEYTAFLDYAGSKLVREVSTMLSKTKNFELASFSTKREIASFLSTKEDDHDWRKATTFIKTLVKIDSQGVLGTKDLLKRAIDSEMRNSAFVHGFYAKAEIINTLLKAKSNNPDFIGMTIYPMIEGVKDIDIRLETTKNVYLIKIKNSTDKAIQDVDRIRTTASQTFLSSDSTGKRIIPVCVIQGIHETRNLLKDFEEDRASGGLKELLSISHPGFEIWDIYGNSFLDELRELTQPRVFKRA